MVEVFEEVIFLELVVKVLVRVVGLTGILECCEERVIV
jgi:hypothetical protein